MIKFGGSQSTGIDLVLTDVETTDSPYSRLFGSKDARRPRGFDIESLLEERPVRPQIVGRPRFRDLRGPVSVAKSSDGSPEYFATLRRRSVTTILRMVDDLPGLVETDNVIVGTHNLVQELRATITTLSECKTEGNSRAIFRQLRDCLLNGGWDQWRDARKRLAATKVLQSLQKDGQVTPQDVDSGFELLLDAGLSPVALPSLDMGE